jgi:hypothetical protein
MIRVSQPLLAQHPRKEVFMRRLHPLLFASCLPLLLAGCVTNNSQKTGELTAYEKAILLEQQRTVEVLSKAALISSKSLAVMARTRQALNQPTLTAEQIRVARAQNDYIPVGMEAKHNFPWDGAPEPYLATIAAMSHYKLVFANQRPPITKDITVSNDKINIKQMIYAVEQQTTGYIEQIDVDDKSAEKVITIYYTQF